MHGEVQGGVKHDLGKTMYELLPPEFLEGVAYVLTFGAKKYAARNWEHGIAYGRCFGALMRHLWAWWRGEDLDRETGKSHLWHAGCELAFLITFEARGMTQFDDRWKGVPDESPTRDNVPVVGGEVTAALAAPREDAQPVSGRHGGLLVQWSDVGLVGRVQMDPSDSALSGDPARPLSEAVALAE
jgi:hypothetical protein